MHKIDGPGHLNGQFVNEDPALGRAPTLVTADWLNAVQNELVAVVEAAGLALDKANSTQLLGALRALEFPVGTRMPFAQASAPTGWTQDTSDNADNRMLRVVKTAGGGVDGTHSPILNNVVPAHTHGFTTGLQGNDHAHYVSGSTSGNGSHSHTLTLQNTTGAGGNPGPRWSALTSPTATNTASTDAAGYHDHTWGNWTTGINSNHNHSGSTDNGSSQTTWQPRYIDLIICTKN